MAKEVIHWADQAANRVVQQRGDKDKYTVAAGITPSGTIHIGNFREIITVDLVNRALKSLGKEVRYIYSWDDYDVFRKVPSNMPKQDVLKEFLRKPIVDTPDTFDCGHASYVEHNEKPVEETLPLVGVHPEFLYQSKKYRGCEYADEMKFVLNSRDKIKAILDKFRKEPLPDDWFPVSIYCETCNTDETKVLDFDGEYTLTYECKCGFKGTVNFKEKGIVKLPWRVDWPMRWHHEQVDFEPGGKEHSTVGGSFSTAKLLIKELYNETPPVYQKYDFIIVKGTGGKMSSSSGNVITLQDTLKVYQPEIVRWLFVSTRPDAEFAISFDLDVLSIYEEFDKCERIYFKKEEADEKAFSKQKRIYELSCVGEPPKELPFQPSLRHLTSILQVYGKDKDKTAEYFKDEIKTDADKNRFETRLNCALNWLENYAPDDFKFEVQNEVPENDLSDLQKEALHKAAELLKTDVSDEVQLHEEFYKITQELNIPVKDFFSAAYKVLINKDRGPRLASFVLIIGKEKVSELFGNA